MCVRELVDLCLKEGERGGRRGGGGSEGDMGMNEGVRWGEVRVDQEQYAHCLGV